MDKTFTFFDLLSMSDDDFYISADDLEIAEQYFSSADILEPHELSVSNILSFAKVYDSLNTNSIGFVELVLN